MLRSIRLPHSGPSRDVLRRIAVVAIGFAKFGRTKRRSLLMVILQLLRPPPVAAECRTRGHNHSGTTVGVESTPTPRQLRRRSGVPVGPRDGGVDRSRLGGAPGVAAPKVPSLHSLGQRGLGPFCAGWRTDHRVALPHQRSSRHSGGPFSNRRPRPLGHRAQRGGRPEDRAPRTGSSAAQPLVLWRRARGSLRVWLRTRG